MQADTHKNPHSLNVSPTLLAVDKYSFQLAAQDRTLLPQFCNAFLPFDSSWLKQQCESNSDVHSLSEILNIDRFCRLHKLRNPPHSLDSYVVWSILDRALEHQANFYAADLPLEGVLLVSPRGTIVCLSGCTQSGKSTLTAALTLGFGWKVISEDFIFIQPDLSVVPVVAPISLRPTAPQLMFDVIGSRSLPLLGNRWYSNLELFEQSCPPLQAPLAVHLTLEQSATDSAFAVKSVHWTEYLRIILPISKALRVPGGVDLLSAIFKGSECMLLQNGDLRSRIDFLRKF